MRHKTKAEHFFTSEEKERIKKTTIDVESRTDGEVVVMVVDGSDQYIEAEIIGGIAFGGLLSLVLAVLFFHSSLWFYIPLNFIFFFPFSLLFRKMPAVKAAFIGVKRKNIAVRERALRMFYEKGLYKTRGHTGVLFFISLLERKVWILADKGIHGKLKQDTLNRFAVEVSRCIKTGCACEALCKAIEETGDLLSRHFPKTSSDIDELPDEVITG